MTKFWVIGVAILIFFGYFMYAQTEIKSLVAAKAEAEQALVIATKTIEEKEKAEKEAAAALEQLNTELNAARKKEQEERTETDKTVKEIESSEDPALVQKEMQQLNDMTSKQMRCLEQLVNGKGSNARC